MSLARSGAFREAALRSESRRAYAMIGIALLMFVLVFMPGAKHALLVEIRFIGSLGLVLLLVVQFVILRLIHWVSRQERDLPMWFMAATVVIECLIPTGICAWHLTREELSPYEVLNIPPTYAYGLLICLTTLRLSPGLCILAGAVSGAGYAGAYLYVRGLGIPAPPDVAASSYINTALIIVFTGLAAAWVAKEIRSHVEAALGEVEARHQMAQMEQDLGVARTIQRALLPRSAPGIPGFDIAGWNRSADQTGGDYYDWQALPDGNWIVTLADVSGHGIGPAMVTAACRAYVRASSGTYPDLAALTTRVNNLLAEDLPEGRFVTMVSVLIDPKGGPVGLLSAGHGPIVLYVEKTGQVRDILPQGVPLAVLPDSPFGPADTIELEPGDVLALVTDGFVEWMRASEKGEGEMFGIERLRESLKRHAGLTSAALIHAVAADVAAFAGGSPQRDDLTMVVIRRVG
jgi:serine phosphatase RsbU (regulator of sigma subunit)